eukprot:410580-Amphidinium_carterae.1
MPVTVLGAYLICFFSFAGCWRKSVSAPKGMSSPLKSLESNLRIHGDMPSFFRTLFIWQKHLAACGHHLGSSPA